MAANPSTPAVPDTGDASSPYLARRRTHFVLWRPGGSTSVPSLVIGRFGGGAGGLVEERVLPMRPAGVADVWEIAVGDCGLADDVVYHYWFEVDDTNVYRHPRARLRCTDPAAATVDWRVLAPLPAGYAPDDAQPAAVIRFRAAVLVPTDPASPVVTFDDQADVPATSLPPNERLVIYELPTAWTRTGAPQPGGSVDVGTFRDVRALVDPAAAGANFAGVAALGPGRAHLRALGVTALELLPPADSYEDRSQWGYGTTNYFAPDFDLGRPVGQDAPTACGDFLAVVRAAHQAGIRVIVDSVMAFADRHPYRHADFLDYFVQWNAGDPEQAGRDGFGGDLWKYGWEPRTYDPLAGDVASVHPARRFHLAHLRHWLAFFHVDGVRMDSVNNVGSWDFVREFRDEGRRTFGAWRDADPARRFLVVGEELSMPLGLLDRLDALWNEHFRRRVRNALVGRNAGGQPSFEWTVREMIDCRTLGFARGTQAVNYLGSHDVTNTDGDGVDNDRLYDFLARFGVGGKEERVKLGFVCLLTAVGVPMIFAGDEFADQMDVDLHAPGVNQRKQTDPVNFDRLEEPWRRRVFDYVARLVRLRTTHDALAGDETEFLHVDFTDGRRVVVWRRGAANDPVVVVANFSDWGSDVARPDAEYVVPGWPATPPARTWREVTQERAVPPEWVGREPLYPWEAKVYVLA